jgi:hypothetical protein
MRKERAAREITKLTQTGSGQHYVTQFRTLAEEPDWDKAALLDRFCSRLKTDVRQELLKLTIRMTEEEVEETTIERWMDWAIRVDDLLFAVRGMDKQASGSGNKGSTYRNNDKTNTGKTDRPGWVPAEMMKKHRDENRCIKCGKTGHKIAECRAKEYKLDETVKGKAGKVKDNGKGKEEGSDNESTESEN